MAASRKQVSDALLDLLAPNPTAGGPFPTRGKRLRDPENLGAGLTYPALYLIKPTEIYTRQSTNQTRSLPAIRTMEFFAVIYTNIGADENAIPADAIDNLLDIIDAALKPTGADGNGGRQTLGGLVYNCLIDGGIDIAPGDVQGRGTTVVPIHVMLQPTV